ncbi:major intrinsic protein, Aquaporin-like protein [Artemisia annua]|uniref:Major intrinsic protein, Aquaporin-like protein n=1 Tax=Artemisia annua TaxID=35608 RepID=A0A2U1LSH0_ARTAN|nr:major intrinsic protein, Aquaporin-like protein [Artemisia annua]
MVEVGSPATVHPGVTLNIEKEDVKDAKPSSSTFTREYSQKLIAELVATYFLVFAGCGSIMVDIDKNKLLGQPGVAITWGAAVMVMVYTVGHVSGAHINPAVTIAFASCKRFPWKEVAKRKWAEKANTSNRTTLLQKTENHSCEATLTVVELQIWDGASTWCVVEEVKNGCEQIVKENSFRSWIVAHVSVYD